MTRRIPFAALLLALAGCHIKTATERAAAPIVEKNALARGGVDAWRAIKTLSMSGSLEAGKRRDPAKVALAYTRPTRELKAEARHALATGRTEEEKQVQLPFSMELKRPRRTRVEVKFQRQTAVQVFDGKKGWKLRPFLGRHEVEPFTADELKIAAQQTELDGPLIDSSRKGNRVELEGNERVEGRDAYKLKVTLDNGEVRHVWVDSETFLDVKIDGIRRMDGKFRPVFTTYRDYRKVDGVMIPHELETTVEGTRGSEKIVIDHVALNPKLDDDRFSKPD